MGRVAKVARKTGETDILLELEIDGSGNAEINTGIGFFDHMLISFTKHGLFDLKLDVKGDLDVDSHHTIEDVGIVLGQAIKEALGDKKSIKRFGNSIIPMDETLMLCALDLSGRPFLGFEAEFSVSKIGEYDVEMTKEFFYAITYSAGMNLHLKTMAGYNNHHIVEAMFKSFAKALDQATMVDERINDIMTTKGSL